MATAPKNDDLKAGSRKHGCRKQTKKKPDNATLLKLYCITSRRRWRRQGRSTRGFDCAAQARRVGEAQRMSGADAMRTT